MNARASRGQLIDNRQWPVDIAIRHSLTTGTRAGAYIDDELDDFEPLDHADDDRRLIEYFRTQIRLTR